jgi:hypothetical protein
MPRRTKAETTILTRVLQSTVQGAHALIHPEGDGVA